MKKSDKIKSVKEYRQNGHKVKVEHYRPISRNRFISYSRKTKGDVLPHGGFTIVTMTFPDGVTKKGVSFCAETDQFCYRSGVEMAISRIIE